MALPPALGNTVALTFDDGPDSEGCTDALLDILAARGVPATFFVNTHGEVPLEASGRARRALRRMVDEGHTLGNHTARHLELKDQDDETVASEWDDAQAAVDRVLGADAPAMRLLRVPYGRPLYPHDRANAETRADAQRILRSVAARGVHVGWNIDPWDWEAESVDVLVERVRALIDGENGGPRRGTLLLHANRMVTVVALPRIIDLLSARGIDIVPIEAYVEAAQDR